MSLDQKLQIADVNRFTETPDDQSGQPNGSNLSTLYQLGKIYRTANEGVAEEKKRIPAHIKNLMKRELLVWNQASKLLNDNPEIRLAMGDDPNAVSRLAMLIREKANYDHNAKLLEPAITAVNTATRGATDANAVFTLGGAVADLE